MVTDVLRGPLRPSLPRLRSFAAGLASRVRGWRLHAAIPALAGAGLISAGVAMVYLPAGLVVAGLFCLRFDSRL